MLICHLSIFFGEMFAHIIYPTFLGVNLLLFSLESSLCIMGTRPLLDVVENVPPTL